MRLVASGQAACNTGIALGILPVNPDLAAAEARAREVTVTTGWIQEKDKDGNIVWKAKTAKAKTPIPANTKGCIRVLNDCKKKLTNKIQEFINNGEKPQGKVTVKGPQAEPPASAVPKG